MKKLICIRLVNWHAFEDETLIIKDSALISGENGSGKSTILDAIQFVLTCSKNNFNKAANESSKRKLTGYVRFKTGRENNEYERTGNVTAHVALEFYDEGKNDYFVIGAVIDSTSEDSEKVLWYRSEKTRIEKIKFVIDDNPVDIANFKAYGRDIKLICLNSSTDAKKDFLNRLGKLNTKFFELLPKSLAFKPLSDLKDFVYTYMLEEREINIEDLRENIRTFKQFEEILNETKIQIHKLKDIKREYENYENNIRNTKLQEYVILLAEESLFKINIEENLKRVHEFEVRKEELLKEGHNVDNEINNTNDFKNSLQIELNSNSEYRAVKDLIKELENAKGQYEKEVGEEKNFKNLVRGQLKTISMLMEQCKEEEFISQYRNVLNNVHKDNLEEFKIRTSEADSKMRKIKSDKHNLKAEKNFVLHQKEEERKDTEKKISELEKRNLQYGRDVKLLREGIIKETRKTGKEVVPKILCELLEVTDEKWRNAVEGYLNTQRFYMIVEEEDFDRVLKIYERLSRSQGLHSVGIINTRGLEKYDSPMENSLSKVVESESMDAKRYINMVLGKVIMCKDVSMLKNYKTSITPTCMVYKNNVARIIDPKIYKTPFIGSDAYKYQLESAKEKLEQLNAEIFTLKDEISSNESIIKNIEDLKFDSLKEKCDILKSIYNLNIKISKLNEEIGILEKNSSYMDIQIKLGELEGKIKGLKKKKSAIDDDKIKIGSKIESVNNNIINVKNELQEKSYIRESYAKEIGSLEDEGRNKFQKELETKECRVIINNFGISRARFKSLAEKSFYNLIELEKEYNNIYDFGAETGVEGINVFFDRLDVLEKSKVVEYEENVKSAKKNAEEEFKEHFISRIQENITIAKREIKSLNNGLKNVPFGNENYEFKYGRSRENKEYYDMIMDDENIGEGFTLFSTSFENKHKELLNELFEKLTLDDENAERDLLKLTDYRNYMDYDIEIKYNDGSSALFSKVCREKSGGETQTPFYVAMAASFMQLYKGTLLSSDSIGLMLIDEAFDKMDDIRITAMMKFYKELKNLQLIIAAPPQKIEVIAPFMNSVLITMKADKFSYVENMINEHGE